jgi:two-component system sensor histidine kinase/response regulator
MTHPDSSPNRDVSDELGALRAIVEGTARHTGQEFFQSLVRHLAAAVGTRYAFVAEFAGGTMARTLAFWFRDHVADNIEWDVTGTPCEDVVRGNLCHHPAGVSQQFPADRLLVDWGIESYLGVPLCDARGTHLGHLAVLGERPMPSEPRKLFTFRIFAARAAAELERLHYEERLRQSEQRWRGLTEALPQLVWSATPDGACDYFSTQWTEHTGVPETDLLGWRWLATLHPDDREPTRRLWADSVAGRGPYDVEYRVRRRDGTYRWYKTRGTPIRDGEGIIAKWFGTCTDVTDLREIEEALRASEERFRGTFENAAVGTAHRDAAGRFLRVNEKFCAIVGYSREELLQKTMRDITHPDDLAASIDAFEALWQGESSTFGLEKRYVRKDGSLVWGELFASLQRDAAGKPAYDVGIINDVSERKRLEEELRASEERRRLILDNAHDAFVAMSADGLIAEWNRQAEITFGWPRAEAVGRVLSETIIPPQFREAHHRGVARFLATAEGPLLNRVIEVQALRRDGGEFPAEISIAPVRLGEQCLFAAFIRDVTERKRAEEELRRAKEVAEAANRAKDEFLANVSHEIRTPMNAILGMTDLALDTLLPEDQRQYLTTVKSAADSLLGVINDILDFAKIEAGRLELDTADFSLSCVLGSTLRTLSMRAHKKGLELVCQQRPGVPDALIGDAGRLRQVLLNLVGNAIKFTERGEVVVLVETAGEPAPQGDVRLRFTVTDTGIGIPPERQSRIFQAFEQADTSTTRKYEGTGLGLTIAARLVALMGGQIIVSSEPGQGSTFAFTARFGLRPHQPETSPASPPVELRGLPVLIVDDNATNRHILEEWLRGYAMEPTVDDNAATAMDVLSRGVAQGRPYPLALLDGRMPDVDGLALAARIRLRAELSATRIILLTSGDRPGDLARARQLGISAILLKPLQQRELMETVLRVMGHEGDPEELLASPAVVRPPVPAGLVGAPLRILAAEDNVFNRDLLEHVLSRLGLSAAMAVNGREALALLECEPFDLLLLDVHMPELDGFGVVGAIRERERTAGGHLPVIALTARSRREDRERCLRAGMDECLTKPYSAADLWATMDRVLRRKDEGGRMKDEKDKTSAPDSSFVLHPSSFGEGLIDPVVLLAACGGDPAMLRKMCGRLQSLVPEDLAAVRDAFHDQDALRLREAAHKLYGTLSAFSTVAGDRAADLEDLAARGMLNEAPVVVEQLDRCATELVRLAGGLTVETLRKQAEATDDPNRAAGP